MSEPLIPLEPDHFYHVYNHAVGDELFFRDNNDYRFFLNRLKKYIVPFFDVYGYALMPNHFHLILNSLETKAILAALEKFYESEKRIFDSTKGKENRDFIVLPQSLSNFFNSYSKNYNKIHGRKGTLFTRAFRRKEVGSDTYLQDLIKYVHLNPVKANFCQHPWQWKFSSYNDIVGTHDTFVKRDRVIELFDDLPNFIAVNNNFPINLENR